ncbi:TIGR00730 family Rossman fold protein [Paenibacillus sp. ACRRX]|uniref:LOG family protein n=1 Tax=Paenibacillus sp. ACRRX TaxID=2918206 RepID=UPI001EF65D78|nr:TIGR00730 family Rossman fold protein [Paenibacillus sp. ACRRX]MCG7409713.1 TIGR00730 family Rossman fold protein [Paenibacillus sp. ACRRX]
MKSICVYAGSNLGNRPEYAEQARQLGVELAKRGIRLIYGGSKVGLMGEVANSVLAHGGKVTGVMPTGLFKGEMMHTDLTELVEVKDMHERKATMIRLADGFIAMPGGFGTLEEWFEVMSWSQLGIHERPVGLLNVADFYTPLLRMIDHSIEAGFALHTHRSLVIAEPTAIELLEQMEAFKRPVFGNKWKQLDEA